MNNIILNNHISYDKNDSFNMINLNVLYVLTNTSIVYDLAYNRIQISNNTKQYMHYLHYLHTNKSYQNVIIDQYRNNTKLYWFKLNV